MPGITQAIQTGGVGSVTVTIERLGMAELLFVVDGGDDKIQVRARDTLGLIAELGTTGTGDSQFNAPTQCACDLFAVYVADSGNDRLKKHAGGSLAYHSQFDTSAMEPGGIGYLHVDRKRVLIGRTDTQATVYIRHKNAFGEEMTAVACGAGNIVGLCAYGQHFYVAKSGGTVEKWPLAGGAAVATWNGVPLGYALAGLTCDGEFVYALCTQAVTDGRVMRLYASDLTLRSSYDLTGYQDVRSIAADSERLYFLDGAGPTLDAVAKGDGAAIVGLIPQTDMVAPTGLNLLPPYFDSLPPESIETGEGTATMLPSVDGEGEEKAGDGEGTASFALTATGEGSLFPTGAGAASLGMTATGEGGIGPNTDVIQAITPPADFGMTAIGEGSLFPTGAGAASFALTATGEGEIDQTGQIGNVSVVSVTLHADDPETTARISW